MASSFKNRPRGPEHGAAIKAGLARKKAARAPQAALLRRTSDPRLAALSGVLVALEPLSHADQRNIVQLVLQLLELPGPSGK